MPYSFFPVCLAFIDEVRQNRYINYATESPRMPNDMRYVCFLLICMWLALLSGCSFIIQPALVPNRNVDKWTVADPNSYGIECIKSGDGTYRYSWNHTISFDPNHAAIPYYGRHSVWQIASAVCAQLNGRDYFTVFDTGASPFIMIEDTQINRHKMPVLFFDPQNKLDSYGLAFADSLRVGPIEYKNAPCFFLKYHAEHRLLGLVPVHRFEWIVLPLDLMSAFGCIEFDQVANKIRISEAEPFTPDSPSEWITFPFEIRKTNISRLLFKIPLEGIEATLFLDTGAAFQLNVLPDLMRRLYQKRPDLEKQSSRRKDMYSPYAGGVIKSKKFTAGDFHFADQTFSKVEIFYPEKDPDPAPPFDGTIGINLFYNTLMVLDFKQNLMWVKKTKGSLFGD